MKYLFATIVAALAVAAPATASMQPPKPPYTGPWFSCTKANHTPKVHQGIWHKTQLENHGWTCVPVGGTIASAAAEPQAPGRVIYCTNKLLARGDGSLGVTQDIEASQMGTDPYTGGRLAWWVNGGATCDYPALTGLHFTGTYFNYEGFDYEVWA